MYPSQKTKELAPSKWDEKVVLSACSCDSNEGEENIGVRIPMSLIVHCSTLKYPSVTVVEDGNIRVGGIKWQVASGIMLPLNLPTRESSKLQ